MDRSRQRSTIATSSTPVAPQAMLRPGVAALRHARGNDRRMAGSPSRDDASTARAAGDTPRSASHLQRPSPSVTDVQVAARRRLRLGRQSSASHRSPDSESRRNRLRSFPPRRSRSPEPVESAAPPTELPPPPVVNRPTINAPVENTVLTAQTERARRCVQPVPTTPDGSRQGCYPKGGHGEAEHSEAERSDLDGDGVHGVGVARLTHDAVPRLPRLCDGL